MTKHIFAVGIGYKQPCLDNNQTPLHIPDNQQGIQNPTPRCHQRVLQILRILWQTKHIVTHETTFLLDLNRNSGYDGFCLTSNNRLVLTTAKAHARVFCIPTACQAVVSSNTSVGFFLNLEARGESLATHPAHLLFRS